MLGWNSTTWNTTTSQFYSSPSSITDSPSGNYPNNTNRFITTSSTTSIPQNALFPKLSFYAKWDIEAGYDYAQVLASDNNGATWNPLCGLYTKIGNSNQDNGNPLYDGKQLTWVKEEIDLSDYIGKDILIRFRLISDNGVTADGFYFDDLDITYIIPFVPSGIENSTDAKLINAFPNPASNYITVNYNLAENGEFKIFDQFGKLVHVQTLNYAKQSEKVDISALSSGTYFYYIQDINGKSKAEKLVVIK
jgi:hypothetical protein